MKFLSHGYNRSPNIPVQTRSNARINEVSPIKALLRIMRTRGAPASFDIIGQFSLPLLVEIVIIFVLLMEVAILSESGFLQKIYWRIFISLVLLEKSAIIFCSAGDSLYPLLFLLGKSCLYLKYICWRKLPLSVLLGNAAISLALLKEINVISNFC